MSHDITSMIDNNYWCMLCVCVLNYSCYQQYVKSGPSYNFPSYRASVNMVTENFQRVSLGVRSKMADLEAKGLHAAAISLISQLQDLEKAKLSLVSTCTIKCQVKPTVEQAPPPPPQPWSKVL